MRTALVLLALLFAPAAFAPVALAQTTHQVAVRSFEFDPASLEIRPGDTVVWTNEGGRHNVNEREPGSMPEGFGTEPSSELWTYSFTFDSVGDYRYQCDPHAGLMQGEVFVRSVLSSEERPLAAGELLLSTPVPNPAASRSAFSLVSGSDARVEVAAYDLLGRRVAVLWSGRVAAGRETPLALDAGALGLPAGQYIVRAQANGASAIRAIVVVGR